MLFLTFFILFEAANNCNMNQKQLLSSYTPLRIKIDYHFALQL